jgi:hypothetical protein
MKNPDIERCRFNIALSERAEKQSMRLIDRLRNNPIDHVVLCINMVVCNRLN